ncbi:hypothetical protein [Cohnella zeiphila]|uniref:Uncharacterized protein n=1 Tax=Cohnella zeiphila TaxID=2761120 RepID=A0A7X0SQ88_9BACL|nr:hypothetical protein [Cohnella zeiphila]MBB6733991.1 hypothetical protein [Cohnella zeiphila]
MSESSIRPVPTARQLEFQEWEFGLFIVRMPAVRVRGPVLEVTDSDGTPELRELTVHYAGESFYADRS